MDMEQTLYSYDENLVRLWLLGTDVEAERAISALYDQHYESIVRILNSQFPGITDLHEKGSIVLQALQEVYDQGRNGTLDIDQPLLPLLVTISQRRAIDLLRSYTRIKRTIPPEEFYDDIAAAIHGTSVGRQWDALERRDLAQEVISDFLAWMSSLNKKQRQVAFVIADHFPDFLGPDELYDAMLRENLNPTSKDAVKRIRSIVIEKFRDLISGKYEEFKYEESK